MTNNIARVELSDGEKKWEGQSREQIAPWSGEKQTSSSWGTVSVAPYTSLFILSITEPA